MNSNSTERTCTTCGLSLPLDRFYVKDKRTGRLTARCKKCDNEASRAYRAKTPLTDDQRAEIRARQQKLRDEWRKDPEWRARRRRNHKKVRERYPDRMYANNALAGAVRRGQVVRPSSCSQCDNTRDIQAHHEDYSKPLEVIWLCRDCHVEADRARRQREQQTG